MTIYAFLSIGTFGFLNLILGLKNKENASDDETYAISSFSGLAKTNPVMAAIFAILMLSTAGIPPMAGFFAKFYVISAAIKSGYIITAAIAVLFSVISAFYYLRIIKIMYFEEPQQNQIEFMDRMNPKILIGAMTGLNLAFILFLKQFVMTISAAVGF